MRKIIYCFVSLCTLFLFIILMFNYSSSQNKVTTNSRTTIYSTYQTYGNLPTETVPVSNPDLEKYYFEQWHYPYGALLPQSEMERIWREISALPSEEDMGMVVNSWIPVGPYGMNTSTGAKYTGRILDIEVEGVPSTRLASASGGLWRFLVLLPIPMTEKLTSQAIGSFDSKPGDANTVFVGTGEPGSRTGTGLWRTTNNGDNWTNISMNPTPDGFYRIRYQSGNTNKIHAVTTSGYYRSDNGGSSWTRRLSGNTTDLAINPSNPNIIYTAKWGDGLYKSTTNGSDWSKITSGGIPTTNVGRTAITLCNSSPNIIYVSMARNDNKQILGVYRSGNSGTNWSTRTPPENFLGGQGHYDNVIAVSPTNSSIVLLGGVTFWRTTNGGSSWTKINNANLHVDHHAITWSNDGTKAWVGNDGGMSYSGDAGVNWSTAGNICPITQYVNIDVGVSNTNYRFGGSRDNGISGTTDGTVFNYLKGGDGSGASIDPSNSARIWVTNGVYSGNWAWKRFRSTNSGQNWTEINNGIDPSGQWYNQIRNDLVAPVFIYNNSGPYVYQSTNFGDNWVKFNPSAFPCSYVNNVTVTRYSPNQIVVYACLNNSQPNPNKLRVYDSNSWYERSTGFPADAKVRTVAVHPTSRDIAYALMNGTNTPGEKIFKTTNRGQNWTNITGDFPNVPLGDLINHRTIVNNLYVGTEMGCFRSTNGGTNWHRWNNGMPDANLITDMVFIDSLSSSGKFYIVAGSFGRSMWIREASGDDPISVGNEFTNIPNKYELKQNYPNPFNPTTTIEFLLPVNDRVELTVFDITGRKVASIINKEISAGIHKIKFDGTNLTSGVYFYQIRTSKLVDTKKMLLIK